jgi:hypothetical protein
MLPDTTLPLPGSLARLVVVFGPLFTAPSFRTLCGLACGFLAQTGSRTDAALYGLPPARTGKRGRPRTKRDRLPSLAKLAVTMAFTQVTVTRYGKAAAISAAALTCLWPSVFGTRPVTVVLIRDRSASGYDPALVTADTAASAAQVIERYVSRWSIEVAIEDARQVFGAGQARNRTARAVERTVPFQLACQAITACWYATADHDPADVAQNRARAPWYTTKAQPSTAGTRNNGQPYGAGLVMAAAALWALSAPA